MLRTLVGLAMLWTVQSQPCRNDDDCSSLQECDRRGLCVCPTPGVKGAECDCDSRINCTNLQGTCTEEAKSVCECDLGWVGPDCSVGCYDAKDCQGHGTCNPDGSCACSSGWLGPNCACNPSVTCNGNGECDPSTFECICASGLWTGAHCNIPCAPSPGGSTTCDSQGICFKDQDCFDGRNTHIANRYCDDTFECVCNKGWIGSACNKQCTVCQNGGYCDPKTFNGLPCICEDNWHGSWCGAFCDDAQCGHGKCVSTGDRTDPAAACVCDGDWVDWKGATCDCSPSVTCSGNGKCEGVLSKCKCDSGWSGPACDFPCDPATSCNGHGACLSDATCQCDQHWDWKPDCSVFCDPATTCSGHGACQGDGSCKCSDHWVGNDCAFFCNPSTTCSGHGDCLGDGSCECSDNWWGNDCAVFCEPSTTCSWHGTCQADGSCECSVNWMGNDCSLLCNPSTTCSGHGACQADGSCECSDNWMGNDCALFCNPSTTCSGHGACQADGSCECSDNWMGNDCALFCNPSITCSGHGACQADGSCECSDNWMGNDCALFCEPSTTCSGAGVCQADGSCECYANYMGANCGFFCNPPISCNGRGTCDAAKWQASGLKCNCDNPTFDDTTSCAKCLPHYYGHDCDVYCTDDVTCHGHGACDVSGECLCEQHWDWKPDCSVFCDPATTCNGHGTCLPDATCQCDQHRDWKPDCSVFCDPSTTCSGHGDCLGDGSCECSDNWMGANCDHFCNPSTTCNGRGTCDDAKQQASGLPCNCDPRFDDTTNCQKCLPHYSGHDCDVYCTDDVTCHGNGQCDASGKCLCDPGYNATEDCGNKGSIYGDPHYLNVDNEVYDFHGADPSGYYAYTDDEVSVTTWNYFCDETLHKGRTCVERVAILQKSNGDMVEFKRTDTGMQTSVKLTSRPTPCQASFMNLSSWSPSIVLPTSMRYEAPQHERGATVSLLDAAGRVKMLLTVWYETFLPDRDSLLSYYLTVEAVLYQKKPVPLDGELGAFFLEAKDGNVLKNSTVTNTCLTGRSAAVLNTDEATTTIPTVAEELAKCTSDAAREHALECCAPGKACGTWYAQCLFEACLHYVPGEGCADHMIDVLMFKEQGSEKSCFCPSETMTPDHVSQTCSLCKPHHYPLPGPGVAPADACATRCTSEDCPEESPYCNSRGECSTAEHMRQREGKHTPALAESAWAYHLPSDKHPCAPGKALGRLVELREVLTPENVGPLTFGDEAIMIEARVRMRSATKWARIVDFGNGAKGSVVFGQRRLSKKLGFETHSFEACSTAQGRRVNSPVALPEDEDVWTWVAFTLTKEGVATMYHNNEPVAQVSGVALPEFGTRVKNYVRTPKKRSGDGWNGDIEHLTFSTCFVRSPALPSEWSFNLPKAKHPCVYGEVLGRIVQVEEAQPGSDIGPLTFGDEAIMIEARVQMRSATKWASIIDFGNGAAKGNVVFGQRSASKKLSFESHPFETCSRQQGTRDVNSRVALPEDEDVWTWVAFTLTKDGVATIYHNNEQVTQVTGVALPEFGTRVKNYVRGSHLTGGDGEWDGAIRHLSVSTCSVPDAPVAPIPPVVIPQ